MLMEKRGIIKLKSLLFLWGFLGLSVGNFGCAGHGEGERVSAKG